jgi:uncharacterized protein
LFSLYKNILLLSIAVLFLGGIIFISYSLWIGFLTAFFFLLIFYICNEKYRFVTSLIMSFLVSFSLYQLTNLFIDHIEISKELKILINRGLLIIIFIGICLINLFYQKKIAFFNNKVKWNNTIALPFHSIKLSYFMLIGLLISAVIFIPFILEKNPSNLKSILLFAFLFSIINATLEELIWRGIMLTSLKEVFSITSAIIITSIGFGLLHIVIGIPFMICLLFSFGGLFYGIVVVKTNSIYPAILFHFAANMGMVLSGMIF